jgi:cyclase
MRKLSVFLPILLFACAPCSAQDQDFSKVQITVTRVAGNVYMLQGQDSNIGVSVGEDGLVVVDDEYAPLAGKIQTALRSLSDKPIRFIINTHYHLDHVDGNEFFQQQAPIIAHDNVRKRLEQGGTIGNLSSIAWETKPMPKPGLPILTFDRHLTIYLNGEDIHVVHIQNGHTDGDSIVFFHKSNVVHMGDDFLRIGFPFIDLAGGGSVRGLITGLEEIISELPPDVKVIPGHGVISNLDDVRVRIKMLKETLAVVEKGVKQGKSLDQLKQERVLEPWKEWSGIISSDAFVETLYNDLTGKPGTFILHDRK